MKLRHLPYFALSHLGFYKEIRFGVSGASLNNERPYYIIRRANRWGEAGFFSNYFYALSHFAYALQNGWKPVIDMRNYSTLYSERTGIDGERNAWNFYFRQPHSTREAYASHHFILSNCEPVPGFNPICETNETCCLNPKTAPSLLNIARTLLPIRPELENEFQEQFQSLFHGANVLGIHYRGGDKRNPPPGHRQSIREDNLSWAVKNSLHNVDILFLASDEDGVVDLIRSQTNVPVVELKACRLPRGATEGLHLRRKQASRRYHRYLLGIEVLRDAWFLSRCDSLICGHSNVSNAALFLRGSPYETLTVIDTGAPARNRM